MPMTKKAKKVVEWVSVRDERPPFMEMVLFYDGENVWPGWDEAHPHEDMSIVCADPGFEHTQDDPTHWMLFPDGPYE